MGPRTRVYVDGFNFYYGVVRNTDFKWLDIEALFRRLLPGREVERILYFTARVHPTPWDRTAHIRQAKYLQALATLPTVEFVEGKYTRNFPTMRVLNPRTIRPKGESDWTYPEVFVWKNEEKCSDVSLGARLVWDGCRGAYEEAVVVSNDSDLLEPVRLVRDEIKRPIHVVMPANERTKKTRGAKSVFDGRVTSILIPHITWNALRKCQLPEEVHAPTGPVRKPKEW